MLGIVRSLLAVLLLFIAVLGNEQNRKCSILVQSIFCKNANLDMLTDRDNRLTTAVVCDFTGSVAHITATSEGSVAIDTYVQYSCSHSNGSIINGYSESILADSKGVTREVHIDSEADKCTFYTCFRDIQNFDTACYVNSSNVTCANAMNRFVTQSFVLPSPSPTLENTNSSTLQDTAISGSQFTTNTKTLSQMAVSSTKPTAPSLLPANSIVDVTSSASTMNRFVTQSFVLPSPSPTLENTNSNTLQDTAISGSQFTTNTKTLSQMAVSSTKPTAPSLLPANSIVDITSSASTMNRFVTQSFVLLSSSPTLENTNSSTLQDTAISGSQFTTNTKTLSQMAVSATKPTAPSLLPANIVDITSSASTLSPQVLLLTGSVLTLLAVMYIT